MIKSKNVDKNICSLTTFYVEVQGLNNNEITPYSFIGFAIGWHEAAHAQGSNHDIAKGLHSETTSKILGGNF